MDGAAVAPLILLVVAAIVVAMVLVYRAEMRRADALEAWARGRGLTFTARDDAFARALSVAPFGKGDDAEAREVISGTFEGRPFHAFRLVTVERTRDAKGRSTASTEDHHVVWVALDAALPRLSLAPDSVLFAVAGALGFADVDTESHAFNQRWRVGTEDAAYAHAILAPHVIEELLHPDWEGSVVIVENGVAAMVRPGALEPEMLDRRLARLHALVGTIPPFVTADYGR